MQTVSSQILSVGMPDKRPANRRGRLQSHNFLRACSQHLPTTFLAETSPAEISSVSFHHFNGTSLLGLLQEAKQKESQALPPWLSLKGTLWKLCILNKYPPQYVTILRILAVVIISFQTVTMCKRNLYFQVIRFSWKQLKGVLREDKGLKLIKFSLKQLRSNWRQRKGKENGFAIPFP